MTPFYGPLHDERVILIVEDNPQDVEFLLAAFDEERFKAEFIVAHDGREALDYFFGEGRWDGRDQRLVPSLILLDLGLPKVDGLGVLRALRSHRWLQYAVVLVLTSSDDEQDRVRAENLGSNLFLRKPEAPGDFAPVVRRVGALLRLDLPRPA